MVLVDMWISGGKGGGKFPGRCCSRFRCREVGMRARTLLVRLSYTHGIKNIYTSSYSSRV